MAKQNPLNMSYLNQYSLQAASKLCDALYKSQDRISGQTLYGSSPHVQIGVFILKEIREKWLEEASRLDSPFFDYSAAEVVKNMRVLMNTLSKNILIRRKDLEPFAQRAIRHSLMLQYAPMEYYSEELDRLSKPAINCADLISVENMYKIHGGIFSKVVTELKDRHIKESLKGALVVMFHEAIAKATSEKEHAHLMTSPEALEEGLGKLLPYNPADLFLTDTENNQNNASSNARVRTVYPDNGNKEALVDKPLPGVSTAPPAVKPTTEPVRNTASTAIADPRSESAERSKTLNDAFKAHQETTLGDKLVNNTATRPAPVVIMSNSNLNIAVKLRLISELFDKNNEAFNNCLLDLCHQPDLDAAFKLMETKYAIPRGWDMNGRYVKMIMDLLSHSFSANTGQVGSLAHG